MVHLHDRVRQLTRRRWPPLNCDDLNHQNIQKFPPHLQRCTACSVQNHPTNTSIPASHTINAPIFAIFYFYFYIRCIHHHRPRHRQETLQNRSRRNSPPLAHHSFSRIKKNPAHTHTLLCDCIGVRSQQLHSQKKRTATCPRSGIHFGEMSEPARERESEFAMCARNISREISHARSRSLKVGNFGASRRQWVIFGSLRKVAC